MDHFTGDCKYGIVIVKKIELLHMHEMVLSRRVIFSEKN
jgi:hypothetical protein